MQETKDAELLSARARYIHLAVGDDYADKFVADDTWQITGTWQGSCLVAIVELFAEISRIISVQNFVA